MIFFEQPFWNGPPNLMFMLMQSKVFHHKKQTAQQALNSNQLQQAQELYTEALQIAQTLSHLSPEMPNILTNRSLVYYRQGEFKLALDDANLSINRDRLWLKGYWRAAQAHKELGQVDCALDAIVEGYNVSVNQEQEEDILIFLVEIVSIIISLTYDPRNYLENLDIHLGSIQTQRTLLQILASNNCWEGVSLLVMGVHAGPPSILDAAAASCPLDNLSVGNLLKNTSIPELKKYGVNLAVCLLKSGASYEDIEEKLETHVIHVGLKVALDTENISLIKLMFNQYLKTSETKDALDREGRTAFHVLVHSGRINDSIGETLLRLLIKNGCLSSIPDRNGQLAIDYLTPEDHCFNILFNSMTVEDAEREMQKQLRNQEKTRQDRKKESIRSLTLDSFCKDYCEQRIYKAKVLLQENNMIHAYLRLAEVLKKDHRSDKHKMMKKKALDIVITSLGRSLNPEIPEKLVRIPNKLYEQIINGLTANEKWRQMYFTVKEHRLHYGDLSLPNFAKSMSLAKVIRHSSFQGSEPLLVDVVDCMLNGGAVLDKDENLAVVAAVQACQFKVLEVLLRWGANPAHLTINQGDTSIHAALSIALERDNGNFTILHYFFELFEKDPKKYPRLDPAQTNSDGDGLFHLVAKAKYSTTTWKASELLCGKMVNALVLNKEGKLPKDYINSKNDRRLQFFRLATAVGTINPEQNKEDPNTQTEEKAKDEQQEKNQPRTEESKYEKYNQVVPRNKETVKRHIKELIYNLPNIPHSIFDTNVPKMDEIQNFPQKKKAPKEKEKSKVPAKVKVVDVQEVEESQEPEDEQEETQEDLQIDSHVFENLLWEVECKAEVWKILRDKKNSHEQKQKIIRNIQLLAKGEWDNHLCKELTNTRPTLKLYEAKLTKASRIIWELAIAFSPRLNKVAEHRLQCAEDEADQPVCGERIYSEVIRVWDIVFDHDKIFKSVQRINKSHSRGKECIILKKLKEFKQEQFKAGMGKRIPMVFAEMDSDVDVNTLKEYQESLQRYYPPASSNETEKPILKLYNFDFNSVSHVLQNLEVKVNFPLRLTDLEHAIINLKSKAPILLLGRSGTGKTTCCLYRLWSQFVSYWTGAITADSKLLPRCQIFQQNDDVVDEENGDSEEDTSEEEEVAPPEPAENEEEEEEGQLYDHLHQVFITKNVVLCSEVQKNFKELSHACDVGRNFVSQEEHTLPQRIQDLGDNQFPIFITSKRLLLMLDASLKGPCFFERNEDGSLKVEIQGLAESDGAMNVLLMLEEGSDDEYEDEDQFQDADDSEYDENDDDTQNRPRRKLYPRMEVTYEVFAEEVWPRISKKWSGRYQPSLIWMEIMSFIRGSFEALSEPSGYLSKEEYLDLGRKRAPNFSGEREHIYEIFKKYDHFKRQKFLFDETDLVHNIFNRLKNENEKEMKWIIHQIYVDETQDFTQAELCLLLRICHSPNEMFLTGDTAQSIMRGIAFRFNDLRSLFFYAKNSMHVVGKSCVQVPEKVHQLTYNYRSHAGILSLATSVLDLMVEFFPESFDKLENDIGLSQGPSPVLLESCNLSDLSLLLRGGNIRKASNTHFGAHQAILVVNEAARENIPEELKRGLILTIYEAKGLEFDDIIIYNFFKDSQANKEWRVVTDFLQKLATSNKQSTLPNSESLVSFNADVLKLCDRPRPLPFGPNQLKVLNSELKHLYTAITRARVKVWIFDEDRDKRAPMFEYFKARKLTRNITSAEIKIDSVELMFAEESSTEQWVQRGEKFMKQCLYELAAKCFNRCKNSHMEKIAKAHQSVLQASRMKDIPVKMREAFLLAAEQFLECEQPNKAVICLKNSRENELVAQLYEKMNQLEKAGETYRKLRCPVEESRCYEQLGKFNLAVETLVENDLYEMAIDTLWRYKSLREELDQQLTPPPRILIDNAPHRRHTVESLSYKPAEAYHRSRNKEKMIAALERLPDLRERTDFLIRKNYIEEAAKMFQEAGILKDAVDLYTKKGMNIEALQCAQKSQDKNAIGQSLILDSKIRLSQYEEFNDIEEDVKSEILENLNQAFYSLQDLENKLAAGEAALLTGELTGRTEFINKAFGSFSKSRPRSEIGQLECMHWLVHNSDLNDLENLRKYILGMQNLFGNLCVLAKNNMENERNHLHDIFTFFGFYPAEEENKLLYYPKQQPRALLVFPKSNREVFGCKEDKDVVRKGIFKFLEKRGVVWKKILEEVITNCRNKSKQCPAYRLGEPCKNLKAGDSDEQTCPYLHAPFNSQNFDLLIEYDMLCIELEMYVHLGAKNVLSKDPDFDESLFISTNLQERFMACNWLLEDLIPQNYHNAIISSEPDKAKYILLKLRNPKYLKPPADRTCICARERMCHYLVSLYDEMKRKDSIKVFVTIHIVNHLLNLEIKPRLEDIMSSFEDLMNKESKRKPEWARKLGLMVDNSSDGKRYIRSIARRFCDGFDQITRKNSNPSEALIKFTKFCVLLSNTGSIEVLPHYNQLLLWMEYYTTVAFCLTAKVQNTPNFFFVIPESYIAVVYFIDATFIREREVSTFEAVQSQSMQKAGEDTSLFQNQLLKLVDILCGFTSKFKLNLLGHVFKSSTRETPIGLESYGIAERLLVLVLVFVCNLGKSVNPVVETKLMSELCKIKVWEEYPSRLSEALKLVQRAGSPADVAGALQILLTKRESDSLGYYIWDNFKQNGLRKYELKTFELSKNFFFEEETLQAMNNPHDIVSSKAKTEFDEDDEVHTPITMEEKMQIDRARMEKERSDKENKAGKKIIQFMKRLLFCSKVRNLSERIKRQISRERKEEKTKMFKFIQMTNTGCGICGVQFKEKPTGILLPVERQKFNNSKLSGLLQPASLLQLPQPNHKMVQQIQKTSSPDKLIGNPFASSLENPPMFMSQKITEDTSQEIQEDHTHSKNHKEMVKFYQNFRFKYMREISDTVSEVRGFIHGFKLQTAELVEKHFKDEIYNIRVLCKQMSDVENDIESIIKGCDRQNEGIWGEVQKMTESYHLIKDYVETKARKRKEKSNKQREAGLAKNTQEVFDDDMDAIEQVVKEPEVRQPKRIGKKRKKNRK